VFLRAAISSVSRLLKYAYCLASKRIYVCVVAIGNAQERAHIVELITIGEYLLR
jgi:hypothetical protein